MAQEAGSDELNTEAMIDAAVDAMRPYLDPVGGLDSGDIRPALRAALGSLFSSLPGAAEAAAARRRAGDAPQ